MTTDGPPTPRHLHPIDTPPFDPDYDTPTRPTGPPHDPAAETALLAALITTPHIATQLDGHLDPTDFYQPTHELIWHTWHQLNDTGQPPDPVTLNSALLRAGHTTAARALLDVTTSPHSPGLATEYAAVIRDHARLRAIDHTATRLRQLVTNANPADLDQAISDAANVIDDAVARYGPTAPGGNRTGLTDLSWLTTGPPPTNPPPRWARRTDGHALFYTARVNGLFGDAESGKTWVGLVAGVEALNDGGTFSMIDVDHNGADHTAARLLQLGVPIDTLADPDRFRYYEPEDATQLRAAVTDVTRLAPDVVLLDSIGEILPMLGVKSIDNDEITEALRTVVMPPAKAGSCVLTVDHLPKSTEARATGYAIGGTAKKRAVDGAYIRVEAMQQPRPGGVGRLKLRIEKDRTGELRKTVAGGYAGTFTLDATDLREGGTTWSIGIEQMPKNEDGTFRPTGIMERISTFVQDNDGCTFTDIKASVSGKDKHLRDAISSLVHDGFLTRIKGAKNSWLHHSTIPYREAEDDHV